MQIWKYLNLCFIFFLIMNSSYTFSEMIEFPFNNKNKAFFYLNKTVLDPNGVMISPQSQKFSSTSKDYVLINFEEKLPSFKNIILVSDAPVDKKSGLFFNKESSINLQFNPSIENGLMIEFWAKPLSTIKNSIFKMQFFTQEGIKKEISILLEKGRLKINFENMFITNSNIGENQSLSLISNSKILPDVWVHHKIVYTPNNGKLTYYNNNKIDNETWATKSHLPNSSVLFLDLQDQPKITLGVDYRGLIDNFIMSNNPDKTFSDRIIGYDEGYIHTRVISLPQRAIINLIELDSIIPKDTDYIIEYRLSTTPFDDNTPTEIVPWQEYNALNPQKNKIMDGKYLQARIHLISDPNNNYSPLIKKLVIHFSEFEIPLKPIDVKTYSSNGNLILSLHQSLNKVISGYKIYLGTKDNTFFGDPDNGIQSPIFVPISSFKEDKEAQRLSYTISGLTPYKLYYLKMTAITANGVESEFSSEVKIRIRTLE